MSESEHTPGPWHNMAVGDGPAKYCPADAHNQSILTIVEEDGVVFAAVYEESDASLIAAAPDMLDALRPFAAYAQLRDEVDSDYPDDMAVLEFSEGFGRDARAARITLGQCRAALAILAKVEGRS